MIGARGTEGLQPHIAAAVWRGLSRGLRRSAIIDTLRERSLGARAVPPGACRRPAENRDGHFLRRVPGSPLEIAGPRA